jgi:hypothetical protein
MNFFTYRSALSFVPHHLRHAYIKIYDRWLWSLHPVLKHVTIAKIFFQGTLWNMSVYHHGIIRRPDEYLFLQEVVSWTFATQVQFQKMTKQNRVLKGLRDQECKQGTRQTSPPFPMYLSWMRSKMLSMQTAMNHACRRSSFQTRPNSRLEGVPHAHETDNSHV